MAGVTYKCTNCGGPVSFAPDLQKWSCAFCKSQFTEKDLLPKADAYAQEAAQEARSAAGDADGKPGDAQTSQGREECRAAQQDQVAYHCPSCGSQVMTDATTVATHCYYCQPCGTSGQADQRHDAGRGAALAISKDALWKAFSVG